MADHLTAEKINLEDVGRYFEGLGYKVKKLEQKWRHVTGEVLFENEKLFLKLASTKDVGERTKNEKQFNENANTVWKKYLKVFKIPKIFDEGMYDDRYWFVGEFVFGKPLAEVNQKSDIEEKDLLKAAEIAKNLIDLTDLCLFPKDKEHLRELWKNRIVNMSKEWAKNIKRDSKKLLQFIEENKVDVDLAMSQGDFTPWHVMKTKNEYYLIDSEAAQVSGLKHYDAAYFYHRVYTKLRRPDLAEIFLKKYHEIVGWTEENTRQFALVLASRIVGGYFDAEKDGVTSIELNKQLENNLLSKK